MSSPRWLGAASSGVTGRARRNKCVLFSREGVTRPPAGSNPLEEPAAKALEISAYAYVLELGLNPFGASQSKTTTPRATWPPRMAVKPSLMSSIG